MLKSNEKVLSYPTPGILFHEFSNSFIDIRILFWVKQFSEWVAAKSEVIGAIDIAFKQHGIVIPFPQRDLHIHAVNVPPPVDKESEEKK